MKKILTLSIRIFIFCLLLVSFAENLKAWNQPLKLHLWSAFPTNDPNTNYKNIGNLSTWTEQATSGGTGNWLYFESGWAAKWGEAGGAVNSVRTMVYKGADGSFTAINGYYYTFNFPTDPPAGSCNYAILETSASPVSVSAVSQSPSAGLVTSGDDVTVTIILSSTKCAEEHVFVNYTTDGWTSNNFSAEATYNNTVNPGKTTAVCVIPKQAQATAVQFYVFTSTVASGFNTANVNYLTLNFSNNSGSNFAYSVASNYSTAQTGDWNSPSTWVGSSIPPASSSALIKHNITINGSVADIIGNVNIQSGISVTFGSGGSLTVSSAVSNSGTLNMTGGGVLNLLNSCTLDNTSGKIEHGAGTVAFTGNAVATVTGAADFNVVTITGSGGNEGVIFSSTSTVYGSLIINSGGYVSSAPLFNAASTLKYNTGGIFGRYNEWTSTSGAGYPGNVQISGNTTLDLGNGDAANQRQCAGNLTIDSGSALSMAITPMTAQLTVKGNFTNNGTFYPSTSLGGDLWLHGNFVNNNVLESNGFNGRSIGFYGTKPQSISTGAATTFDYIEINNPAGISFGGLSGNNILINRQLLLTSGTLTLGSTNTITLACSYILDGLDQVQGLNYACSVNGAGGDFAPGSAAGTIICQGKADFLGTLHLNNITLFNHWGASSTPGYGANFHSPPETANVYINGTLQVNQESFVDINAPFYAAGSTLEYNTNGEYNRRVEWKAGTGAGYPYNVHIVNSMLNLGFENPDTLKCGGNITIDNTGALYMDVDWSKMAKPLKVSGNLLNNGVMTLSTLAGGDLIIKGNFINNGSFYHKDRATTFSGSAVQNITGTVVTGFGYLIINNAAGVTLGNSFNVDKDLTLTSGIVTTGTNIISLSSASSSFRTSGYVYGYLRKHYNTGTQNFTYFLGTLNGYSPAAISFDNITTAGSITGTAVQSIHPNVPYPLLALTRYWTFTSGDGIAFTNYDAGFTYLDADFVNPFSEAVYEYGMSWGKYNSGWTYPVISARTTGGAADGGSIKVTGMNTFSDFTGFACANISSQPVNVTACSGQSASFSIAATGSSPAFQWQVFIGSWADLSNGGVYSNVTSSVLNISNTAGMNGYQFRCIVRGSCGSFVISNPAALTVNSAPSITGTTPASRCDAGTVTLTATASSGTINWYNVPSGSVTLATGSSYTPNISSTATYYVDATENGCTTASRTPVIATVYITPVITAVTPASRCDSGTLTLGANPSAGTVSWYASATGGNPLATGTSYSLSLTATTTFYADATENGCTSASRTPVTATVNITPSITATAPASRCDAGTITLGASVSSGIINWYNSATDGTLLNTGTVFITSLSISTSFWVEAAENGCVSPVRSSVTATVNNSPSANLAPVNPTQCPGSSITFSAGAAGTLPLSFKWIKNNSELGTTNYEYIINNISPADAGVYKCVVTNLCGSATSNPTTLSVNSIPLVSISPENPALCPGSSITFYASPNGTSPSFIWYKNNVQLINNKEQLIVNNISSADAGEYFCVATSTCGSATSNISTITLNSPVSFQLQPDGATLCEGDDYSFNVNADGTSPLYYQWLKLEAGSWKQEAGKTTNNYQLITIKESDAGEYKCVVTNVCGSLSSNAAVLNINSVAVIQSQPQGAERCTGSGVTFNTDATSKIPLIYSWYKNGVYIRNETGSSYTISDIMPGDGGNYSCVVTNACGSVTSSNAALTLITKPEIAFITPPLTKCTGDSVLFKTIVSNQPLPESYQWYRNNELLTFKNELFIINSIASEDAGEYKCVVSNVCGESTAATMLMINISPVINNSVSNLTQCEGTNVVFTIDAAGTSLKYQWTKGGSNIPGATNPVFAINNLHPADAEVYSCSVSNMCKTVELTPFLLLINQKPYINIIPITSIKFEGDSLSFYLSPQGAPPFSYQWLKDNNPITDATTNAIKIKPITAQDAGVYGCRITNSCGSSTVQTGTLIVNSGTSAIVSGIVKYDNKLMTPLANTTVYLVNSSDMVIDSAKTTSLGEYIFYVFANGTYTLTLKTKLAWKGGTPRDALLVNRYFVGTFTFEDDLMKKAADVSNEGKINPVDALLINRRFVKIISQFPAPDWIFEKPVITVDGTNILKDIKGICAGDVDASY